MYTSVAAFTGNNAKDSRSNYHVTHLTRGFHSMSYATHGLVLTSTCITLHTHHQQNNALIITTLIILITTLCTSIFSLVIPRKKMRCCSLSIHC